VRYYTREAGVRSARARDLEDLPQGGQDAAAQEARSKIAVNAKNLDKFLGVRRYSFGMAEKENQVGQVTGLAWTEVGGELLTIEAVALPGKGKTITTGKLGEVMQESIQAALSVVRKRAPSSLGIDRFLPEERHPHPPAGRRDSEGWPVGRHRDLHGAGVGADRHSGALRCGDDRRDHLRGEVLPIGGLKEKLLAAVRGGIHVGIDSGRERQGSGRDSRQHQEQARNQLTRCSNWRWNACRNRCSSSQRRPQWLWRRVMLP
jgi:ATP-dependent Lon protease